VSDQNIERVKSMYAAFAADDVKTIIKASSADVVWEVVGRRADSPVLGRWAGLEGIAEFFEAVRTTGVTEVFEATAFHPANDKVFVEGRMVSTLNGSGRKIDSDWLHVFTFRDGQLIGFKQFYDTAQLIV
jgi:ketosteroid isomerase-like protein